MVFISAIESLSARVAEAARGHGCLVLVSGAVAAGKTTLVESLCERHAASAAVLRDTCDVLTPAGAMGPPLRMIGGAATTRHALRGDFLDSLCPPRSAAIAVIEDLHWADEATLDLLVFVGRRVARTRAVVVVTYTDDAVDADHPLHRALDGIAMVPGVHRLKLPAPIEASLAGDPEPLARLTPAAQAVAEAAAMFPYTFDLGLLRVAYDGVSDDADRGMDECVAAGILCRPGPGIRFRHELARAAVYGTVPADRRAKVHALILRSLAAGPDPDAARLAFHAEEAGQAEAVLDHASRAAEQAARLGAHREAVAQYARALRYASDDDPRRKAELLSRCAHECRHTSQIPEAIDASADAISAWSELGDGDRVAMQLARHAILLWRAGRTREADEASTAAVGRLEASPPGPALAAAMTSGARLRALGRDMLGAAESGRRAVDLAEAYGGPVLLARALTALGTAQWFTEPDEAAATLSRGLALARESGHDEATAAALVSLGSGAGEVRRYAVANHWLRKMVAWCGEHDLDADHAYALAWLSRVHFEQGRWSEAGALAGEIAVSATHAPTRIVVLTVLGRLRARRGDPDARGPLEEAWRLAEQTGDLHRTWPVAAGRAEVAWLAGRPQSVANIVEDTFKAASRLRNRWAIGELGFWLWRVGAAGPSAWAAEPFALQMSGSPRAAARAWRELGCPYEAALALADSDDSSDLLTAHAGLAQLGAWPAAEMLARRLRNLGIRRLPRRPRRATTPPEKTPYVGVR